MQNRYESYVVRTLIAITHVAYYVAMIAFYVTCFLSLVIDRYSLNADSSANAKTDTYYVLLVLNCFKPVAWFIIIHYDTRFYYSNADALISGSLLLCVFASTFALEIVMMYEYLFYCNGYNVHYDNPCNDVLYCCYYPNNPTCVSRWGTAVSSACILKNLPKSTADGVRWLSPLDENHQNTTQLDSTTFKLTPDESFVTNLVVVTILFFFEFVLFVTNMARISKKIRKFVKNNKEQFEPLDDDDVFQFAYPFVVIRSFFDDIVKEEEAEPSVARKTSSKSDFVDDATYSGKTNNNKGDGELGAPVRHRKTASNHPFANDPDVSVISIDHDASQIHGDEPASKSKGLFVKRLCSMCFARCSSCRYQCTFKLKTCVRWMIQTVSYVCDGIKSNVYSIFVIDASKNNDDKKNKKKESIINRRQTTTMTNASKKEDYRRRDKETSKRQKQKKQSANLAPYSTPHPDYDTTF